MREFHKWFAWYPVAYGPYIKWLCFIERAWDAEQQAWYYRRYSGGRVYKK